MSVIDLLMPLEAILLSSILIVAGSYLLLYLVKINKKLKHEIIKSRNNELKKLSNDALNNINDVIYTTVYAAQVTVVNETKELNNGKLSKEDAKKILEKVKEDILKQLSDDVKKNASIQIDDIELYVTNRIELELNTVKFDLL